MRPVHTLSASFVYFSVSSRARVFLCLHSQYAWFLMKPSAVEYWWRSGNESSVYENFSSTVSLFGAISGVYCECRLTCRCVWRCVTVLEYILVRCESVCGCINVFPSSSCLAPGRAGLKEESVLQNRVALYRTPAVLRLQGPELLSISRLAGCCMHVCHSCSVQSGTQITTARERVKGWGRRETASSLMMVWESNACGG